MNLQQVQLFATESLVAASKENVMSEISENHALAKEVMRQSLNKIFDGDQTNVSINTDSISNNQSDLVQMQKDLEDLL